jgi:DNA-binding SARP family transcriptional activator
MADTPRLIVRLFGAAEMTFDGEPWSVWIPPRCYLLLALVALREGAPTSRATLAAALWPDELDTDARTNLRRHLHELQRAFPPIDGVEWLLCEGKNVRWNDAAPGLIDARAFPRFCVDPKRAAEAAALYRGDLLEGVFDESILAERERLASLYRELLLRLVRDARESCEHARAVAYARMLLDADEFREDALREWMMATYQSGDREGALAAYDDFAVRLQSEFATLPTAETNALRDAIRSDLPLPDEAEQRFERELSEPARRAWNHPLVGRDDDLTRLRQIWTRAARGSGGTAFVSGEAGIGKSRLSAELAAIAREQGAHVLRGTTSDPESAPYQAILEALRGVTAHVLQVPPNTPWLAVLARVLPEIRSANPTIAPDEEPSGKRAAERLFDAIASAVAYLSRVRPLCIVLEDLHWAGPATIQLVEVLARRIGALPVMLLVTYRSEESRSGHPLRALRASLVRERRAAALPLERLAAEDVARIVESVAKRTSERELDGRIALLSEGNPLFVAQLLESYRETGALPDEASALRSAGDAIALRVARLDPHLRSVAQAAAAAGQPFGPAVIAEIGGWSESAVLDAFGELMDRSLLREAGDAPTYAFTHALVGAAFYRELTPEIRTERHRRIAEILERTDGEDPAALGAIARHWERGGRSREAAAAYVRAARAAGAVFAREEAAAAALRAYELSDDDRTRFDAMSVAAPMWSGTANLQRWRADVERVESSAAALGDEERFAAMRLRERYACQIVDFEMTARVLDDLDALAERTGATRHRAYAQYARGYFDMQRGELEGARRGLRAALESALLLGDPEEIARAREELIGVLLRSGDEDGANAEFEALRQLVANSPVSRTRRMSLTGLETTFASVAEDAPRLSAAALKLLDIATELGDTYNIAKANMLLSQCSGLEFDLRGLRERHDTAFKMFVEMGELRAASISSINHATMELRAGRSDIALLVLDEDLPLFDRLGAPDVFALRLTNRAEALLLAEKHDEALSAARQAHAATLAGSEPRHVDETQTILGAAEGRCGNDDVAVAALSAAIASSRTNGMPQQTAYAIAWLIEICCSAGRGDDAAAYVDELEKVFSSDREVMGHPTFICWALARAARSPKERKRWRETGAEIHRERLARLENPADASAFTGLFFNRGLLGA